MAISVFSMRALRSVELWDNDRKTGVNTCAAHVERTLKKAVVCSAVSSLPSLDNSTSLSPLPECSESLLCQQVNNCPSKYGISALQIRSIPKIDTSKPTFHAIPVTSVIYTAKKRV